jgi:NADPH:quinone reductase-like Zn-dependent oxidoreductase
MPRVVFFDRLGPPEVLQIRDVPLAEPGPGEVRLAVEAFGLNRSESQMRQGRYPMLDATFPSRVGKEAVGRVTAIGPGVGGVEVGQRVTTVPCFDMNKHGVYGEFAVVPAVALAPVPSGLSTVQAAAIWQQYLTAYGPLVEYTSLAAGRTVLVTAATASVGHACIQLAKVQGATVIATTRSAGKAARLRQTGADHVIVTAPGDAATPGGTLAAQVMALTAGRGADVIVDSISGPLVEELAEAAAPRGRIFLYGRLDERPTPYPLVTCMKKALSVTGYTLWEIVLDPLRRQRAQDWIVSHLERGSFAPVIDRTFTLEQIVEAHAFMDANLANGKIVVTVS